MKEFVKDAGLKRKVKKELKTKKKKGHHKKRVKKNRDE